MRTNLDKIPEIAPSTFIRKSFRGNIIFVEGNNDQIILSSIVKDQWKVFKYGKNSSNSGKECILSDFSTTTIENQIAIVDKDYDINNKIKNVYYIDNNDIENTAINKMNLHQIKKCLRLAYDDIEFEKKIFEPCCLISHKFSNLWKYKIHNDIKGIKYITKDKNFETLIYNIIDFSTYEINYFNLCDYYRNFTLNNKNIYKLIMEESSNIKEFRGHDFFSFLKLILKNNNIECNKDIEKIFISSSCKYHWINNTILYSDINNKYNCFY